jgi:hypothetical protein
VKCGVQQQPGPWRSVGGAGRTVREGKKVAGANFIGAQRNPALASDFVLLSRVLCSYLHALRQCPSGTAERWLMVGWQQ